MNLAMSLRDSIVRMLYGLKRWMYRGDHPRGTARVLNWLSRVQYSAGFLSPRRAVTLEVQGRRTGRPVRLPVVVADYDGERYLVSMLGADAGWVRNVRAADGRVRLYRRGSEDVRLEEVESGDRAPILRRYLEVAPGARPHFPIDRHAALPEFAEIADRYPTFRITSVGSRSG